MDNLVMNTHAPVEPPRCSRPFSSTKGRLHYIWRGEGPGLRAKIIGIYNPMTEQWILQRTTGCPPSGRCAGGCVSLGNYLYCIGGYNLNIGTWSNDIHKLNLDTFEWSEAYPQNNSELELPICKDGGGLVATDEQTLIFFGGWGIGPIQPGSRFTRDLRYRIEEYGWTNEFHCFQAKEGVWSSPQLKGEKPPPCCNFSFTKVNKQKIVLFGGERPGYATMDSIYLFHLKSMEVTRVSPVTGEAWPAGRFSHAACCLNYGEDHPKVLLSGGIGKDLQVLGDMWMLDVESCKWTEVKPPKSVTPRWGHSMTAIDLAPGLTEVLVFGGCHDFGYWHNGHPISETTLLRFECLRSVTEHSNEKWTLMDVAHNDTRGSSQRLKEKMENIRKAKFVCEERQQYVQRLEDLMTDTDTIELCYLKVFLVGPPGVGKTTTLNRLLRTITNILSDGDNEQSTLLANCIQVLVCIADDMSDWLSSKDVDEETKLLIKYLCGKKVISRAEIVKTIASTPLSHTVEDKVLGQRDLELGGYKGKEYQAVSVETSAVTDELGQLQLSAQTKQQVATYQQSRLMHIKTRLRQLIASGDYSKLTNHLGNTLLNINDIGGQPCFLEMLPALSTGPALYLTFLDLSKELDKPYKISFSRDNTIITPYDAVHTVEATIWQILSAIASVHRLSNETPVHTHDAKFSEKFERFLKVCPVAALIGTHMDKLNHPEEKIKQTNEALKKIIQYFNKILVCPTHSSNASFFSVDNYTGTEQTDIGPLREFINTIFSTHFKEASIPICPKWLIFGVVLRREYKIVPMDDCLEIGRMLEMDDEEVRLCLWYLNCIGTIMHYISIADDDDGWFKNHVICSPQVIFDSISQLILPSLRVLHSGGPALECDREELIKKGQFSIESINKYCSSVQDTKKLERDELVPAKQLVKLLDHVNLLSPITHKEADGSERITYLMPAVLECALPDELTTSPTPDANNPEPLHITFSCGYVPTGTFCGLITRLVSLGPHGILGIEWGLVEEGVKRNCVSFHVDYVNEVTLICHDISYEIRVNFNDSRKSLHDLCTYVLSALLYTLKSLYEQLVPLIAFQCPCPKHTHCTSFNSLCSMVESKTSVRFLCGRAAVALRTTQQVWMGKCVTPGKTTALEVLKFTEKDFSFHWTKEGSRHQIHTTIHEPNVKEAGKVVLTVFRALFEEQCSASSTRHLERPVLSTSSTKVLQPSTKALTIQELRERTGVNDTQLDTQIEEHDFPDLAGCFDEVDTYLYKLNLTPAQQTDVKDLAHRRNTTVAMTETLKLWHQPNPFATTFRALLEVLLELRRGDVAVKVCQYITSRQ